MARIGARYGFGFVFRNRLIFRRRVEPGRVGMRLRRSFEELGPTFAELGRFLSTRRDLLPPDVAAELGRTSVAIKPTAFAEVRRLVERELDNTLERLFLHFDEVPARLGCFTQAHRAVLPGGRPALVVLRRPGVRRDLLAMRPVADLTRRRLGDRLPLDPVEMVSEFVAHTNHRRDMYFAAQIARRLRELDNFPLRVPGLYRDHSTSRCITLEAPGASVVETPDEGQYRKISDALVRLAIAKGIFFADLAPERFAVDGSTGELWLSDPTEVFSLAPERMRGIAEVLAAVRREDVDAVTYTLPLAGGLVPREDATLKRELRETIGALGGPLWREHPLFEIRDRSLEAMRRGGAKLQVEVAQLLQALASAEALGREMGGSRYSGTTTAADASRQLISRYRNPRYVAERTARRLARPEAYADYPRQIHALLNELKDGEVQVRFRHSGLDELISRVDILANRLVFAFLIGAIIIGSSMLGVFVRGGTQILGVSIFGFVGFVVAAVLGLLLLIGIIRSGRL